MTFLRFSSRPALPLILQTEKSECGLACLAMLLNFHGHRVDLNSLRASHATSQQGLSLKNLMALAERLQLSCRALRVEPEEIRLLQVPAILHWDLNHFVVLAAVDRKGYRINDPAVGVRVLTAESFSKHFTGVALELWPGTAFSRKAETMKLRFTELWTSAVGLRQSIVQILVLSALMQGFALALPFYTQTVLDEVLVRYDLDLLTVVALGFLLLTLINVATDWVRSLVVLHLSNSLGFQLAVNLKRHLLKLPLDYFGRRHIGDIVSRFGSIFKLKDFITSGIVEVVVDGLMVLSTFVLILVYSPQLSLAVVALLLVNTLAKLALYRALRRESEELVAVSAAENTTFMENLRAIQGIKLFNKELDRNAVWQNVFAEVTNKGIGVQKVNIHMRIARNLIYGIENILIVWMAAREVMAGALSVGMMMAFLSYKDQLYRRFFALVDKYFDFRLLDIHLDRLADIVHAKPEAASAPVPAQTCRLRDGTPLLALDQVSFRYSSESPWLFRNISLSVQEGESIAIIGPTGCGKSSLLKLILGLYQPGSGSVRLGGNTIAMLGLARYRDQLSAVLQDDSLLSGSIFENICFFAAHPDRAKVEQAARQAAIADDIESMPMGYETLVGNMGAALSGGQIQRILLARAFYKGGALLVLDEASSHLDLATEQRVVAAIRNMKIARIMVAHRPQSFLAADRIYALSSEGLVLLDKQQLLAQSNVAAA